MPEDMPVKSVPEPADAAQLPALPDQPDQPSEPTQAVQSGDGQLSPEELEELRANEVAFSWQASEYVHHHKGPGWYAALGGIVLVLVAVAFFLHYWLEIGAFLAMGGAIMVYARKPPRTLLYELTPTGITIEGRQFPFTELRSFGVLPDVEWHTIDLEPTKRFNPRMTLLFEDEDFDSIVGHLELHLPRVDRKPDVIEQITRFVRF